MGLRYTFRSTDTRRETADWTTHRHMYTHTHTHARTHTRALTLGPSSLDYAASGQMSASIWQILLCPSILCPLYPIYPFAPFPSLLSFPCPHPSSLALSCLLLLSFPPCIHSKPLLAPLPFVTSHPSVFPRSLFSASSSWDFLLQVLGPQGSAAPLESSETWRPLREHRQREFSLSPDPKPLPWGRA